MKLIILNSIPINNYYYFFLTCILLKVNTTTIPCSGNQGVHTTSTVLEDAIVETELTTIIAKKRE